MTLSIADQARAYFEEVWNNRREDAITRFVQPHGIGHLPSGECADVSAFRENVYLPFLNAFPDLHIAIEDVLAEGDRAVVRWRTTGTHLGDALGMPATGRKVEFLGMSMITFRDGKIAEAWDCWDQSGVMQRLRSAE